MGIGIEFARQFLKSDRTQLISVFRLNCLSFHIMYMRMATMNSHVSILVDKEQHSVRQVEEECTSKIKFAKLNLESTAGYYIYVFPYKLVIKFF